MDVKVIDKAVDRIVEVFQKKPVAKVQLTTPHMAAPFYPQGSSQYTDVAWYVGQPAERVVEKIEIKDVENVKEFQVTQLIPGVQVGFSKAWHGTLIRKTTDIDM